MQRSFFRKQTLFPFANDQHCFVDDQPHAHLLPANRCIAGAITNAGNQQSHLSSHHHTDDMHSKRCCLSLNDDQSKNEWNKAETIIRAHIINLNMTEDAKLINSLINQNHLFNQNDWIFERNLISNILACLFLNSDSAPYAWNTFSFCKMCKWPFATRNRISRSCSSFLFHSWCSWRQCSLSPKFLMLAN